MKVFIDSENRESVRGLMNGDKECNKLSIEGISKKERACSHVMQVVQEFSCQTKRIHPTLLTYILISFKNILRLGGDDHTINCLTFIDLRRPVMGV